MDRSTIIQSKTRICTTFSRFQRAVHMSILNARPRRSIVGQFIAIIFWSYNGIMAIWMIQSVYQYASIRAAVPSDDAKQAMTEAIWFSVWTIGVCWAMGALVLGQFMLLTMPKRNP